jgi:site-specific recombinase XerD
MILPNCSEWVRRPRGGWKKFFEFFTVPIRNANTRAAYYRAIQQFLAWSERASYQDLEDIEPIMVAAYIEQLESRIAEVNGRIPVRAPLQGSLR